MPAKIAGVLFLVAGYLLFRRARKQRRSERSRPSILTVSGLGQIFGAIICFVAAYLCLLNSITHAW